MSISDIDFGPFIYVAAKEVYVMDWAIDELEPYNPPSRRKKLQQPLPKQYRTKSDDIAQALLEYISAFLDVRYNVLANGDNQFHVDIILRNVGTAAIPSCCWEIYFYHNQPIQIYSVDYGKPMKVLSELFKLKNNNRTMASLRKIRLAHVVGFTFCMSPGSAFLELRPGKELGVRIRGPGWILSKTDVMPNWYVANDLSQTTPRVIRSTEGEELKFVGKFVAEEENAENPYYDSHGLKTVGQEFYPNLPQLESLQSGLQLDKIIHSIPTIIPTPVLLKNFASDRHVKVGYGWKIFHRSIFVDAAVYLRGKFLCFNADLYYQLEKLVLSLSLWENQLILHSQSK